MLLMMMMILATATMTMTFAEFPYEWWRIFGIERFEWIVWTDLW